MFATALEDTPANRTGLEPLRHVVGRLVDVGRDPRLILTSRCT
jgi:hypothetical protein